MNKKNTKVIVIAVLALAGLLGIIAVGTAMYYSSIDDVTPDTTGASLGQNKCNEISLKIPGEVENSWVKPPAGDPINIDQDVLIGAEFQTAILESTGKPEVDFREFHFTINNSDELEYVVKVDDPDNPVRSETLAGFMIYYPEFVFSDWDKLPEGTTSLTVSVVPYGEALDGELEPITRVLSCLPGIFELSLEAPDPSQQTCVAAGETQTDFCANINDGETCKVPVPDCCEGW